MNILYCHNNFYTPTEKGEVYSAGQFPYRYWSPYLEAFGSLTVIGRKAPSSNLSKIQKMNISNGPYVDFILFPDLNNPKIYAKEYKAIHSRMKQAVEQSDAVIIRAVSDLGWIAYKYAKAMGKPIAMEMAACAWDSTWHHGSLLGKIYAPIRYWRDRIMTRNADYTIYVSQKFLQNRYPTYGQVESASNVRIKRPINDVLDVRIEKIKNHYDDSESPVTIGLIGTLSHKLKGIDDAIKAIALLNEISDKKFILRCLGPGNPSNYIKQALDLKVHDLVHFDGMVQSGDAVMTWLDYVDIYIQPSYQEGVPRATIEAMSRACPVIGSTAGGIPELLGEDFLHEPGDYKKLARLILSLSDNAETQITAANKNFEKASSFSEDIVVAKRTAFWKSFSKFVEDHYKVETNSIISQSPV